MTFRISQLALFLCGLLFALLALIRQGLTYDINVHDTYFVILQSQLYGACAVCFFLFGGFYWLANNNKIPLNNTLSELHIWGTTLGVLLLFVMLGPVLFSFGLPDAYYTNSKIVGSSAVIFVTLLVVVGLQLVFMLNLIYCLTRRRH